MLSNIHIPAARVANELGVLSLKNIVLLGARVRTLELSGIDWRSLLLNGTGKSVEISPRHMMQDMLYNVAGILIEGEYAQKLGRHR